ncbi:hypothetical protein NIES4071_20990 [Calothrix sp. NIES-4071]|nr:hypothetical protein NIES4071_20990 [Calothrix sp. NIES-4071]BAZ56431.1 hypothetical protein NIES4105_20940 [Calothrix sp. NIES-4105]
MRFAALIKTVTLTYCITSISGYSNIALAEKNLSPQNNVPLCYYKSSDGRVIDLSSKCGFISPEICHSSLGSPERDVILSKFCQQNPKCLLNNSCGSIPAPLKPVDAETPAG